MPLPHLLIVALAALALAGCPAPDDDGREGEGEGEGEGDVDEFGDGVAGDDCAFNADCGVDLRCACDGACACEEGARGTGENGVDVCATGNDCRSSVCVEDSDDGFTCSGACVDDDDCGARLPRCVDIAFVGRICVRAAP